MDGVEDYMDYFLDELPRREAVDLMLVLLGERPACLVMDPDEEEGKRLRDLCREFDLEFQEKESEQGSRLSSSGFFISVDSERFELLEGSDGRFYGFSDRDVGRFLGFPEDDVEFFAENVEEGPIEAETRDEIRKLASKGVIGEEAARMARLVTYVPRPEEENILRAVEHGKKYRDALLEYDRENGSKIGRRVLEEFFEDLMV